LGYVSVQAARKTLERYDELKSIIAILGIDELSEEDRATVEKANKLTKYFTQPFYISEDFNGIKGQYVALTETIAGVKKILGEEVD
jgi:F-type H+-transporting ATPase subunit beta